MKIGYAVPTYELATGRTVGIAQVSAQVAKAEALGFDSAWVMDHMWVQRGENRYGGHEPMVTLAHAAALTTTIQLGVLVLCNAFRHPAQLAREALALADASGGRFILGLGAGWHQPEYDAFGFPFDHKVSRLEDTLKAIRPLLRGERVTAEGRYGRLTDATLLKTSEPPPIWVAAGGERMLGLTATHADGWNVAWHGPDRTAFVEQLGRFREALKQTGRAVEISVGVFALPLEGEELARLREVLGAMAPDLVKVLDTQVITGSPAHIAEVLRSYEEAGAEHVIMSVSISPFGGLDPAYLDRAAEVVKLLR